MSDSDKEGNVCVTKCHKSTGIINKDIFIQKVFLQEETEHTCTDIYQGLKEIHGCKDDCLVGTCVCMCV